RTSVAKFLNQLLPSRPGNGVGVVQITSSNGTASVVGLRFTGNIFTTIPESVDASISATANTYHVFPQFADGKFSDGSYYRTTRMYVNPNSGTTADCTTRLRGLTTDGSDTFTSSLAPYGSLLSATKGTQAFQSGYATMQCSA